MAIPNNWSPKQPEWSEDTYNLLIHNKIENILPQTLEEIIQNSTKFIIDFPVDTGRCAVLKNSVKRDILERNINSVYPLIHESVLELCCKFILFKREHGTSKEKDLYKDMTLLGFIDRLLKKRAVMFMGRTDKFLLLNKKEGSKIWETIGTDKEAYPLSINECLSYDELKLSAFLSVSSYTHFVNEGDRDNMAKAAENRENIMDEGVIIGLIGPRVKKPGVMEYQEIVTAHDRNTNQNGYGSSVPASIHKLFAEFYQEHCLDYQETLDYRKTLPPNDERYTDLWKGMTVFDNYYYSKRLAISIDTLLLEANHRAEKAGKTAYIHVVGLGLGVWKISSHQEKIYVDTFAKRIQILGVKLHAISDICFSYINLKTCGNYGNGEIFLLNGHPLEGIRIHFLKRNPHEKLPSEGKLLVVSYAWDSNALPGNEYWKGYLGSSGDSAAASSTQITEIHNPHINPLVSAGRLQVIRDGKIMSFVEYQEYVTHSKLKRKHS